MTVYLHLQKAQSLDGDVTHYQLRVDLIDRKRTPPLEKSWVVRLGSERPREWATSFRALADMMDRETQ